MFKSPIIYLILLSVQLAIQACSNNNSNDISMQDREFLAIAGSAGIMEVEMGKLARTYAVRPDLKQYGEMMVKEHTLFNEEFQELLQKLGEKVPEGMNERNREMVADLARHRGQAFDSAYAKHMIEDHKLGVEKFTEALQIAKNRDYRNFLEKGLHIVTHHYKEALRLQREKL